MSRGLLVLSLLFSITVVGQSPAWKSLGTAEKCWVVFHPFVAKKAHRITQQVVMVMDSLKEVNYFEGNTRSGSKADAVRHAYWMAELRRKIGKRRALKLGNAHEKKNKQDFEKGRLEEQLLPDEAAMQMDLKNNEKGVEIGRTKSESLSSVLKALQTGELFWIKQNGKGEFLDKNNHVIPSSECSGKWGNERLVVPTNSVTNQIQN